MVTINEVLVDLAGISESLQAEGIVLVDILLLHWDELTVNIKRSEDSGLFWVDHGILVELDEEHGVDLHKSLFVAIESIVLLLVVEVWEED